MGWVGGEEWPLTVRAMEKKFPGRGTKTGRLHAHESLEEFYESISLNAPGFTGASACTGAVVVVCRRVYQHNDRSASLAGV
jgi:hypothetical protein